MTMFQKLKQRIEDGEQHQQRHQTLPSQPKLVLSSTPKKPHRSSGSTPSTSRNTRGYNNLSGVKNEPNKKNNNRENKWEKRRISSAASLTSSRESLYSLDSTATAPVCRLSYNGEAESSYSVIGTPVESPLIIERFREIASKDEVLSELSRKNEQVKKLEAKINEMALAYMEQTKQRDKLEESLQNLRNDMHNHTQLSINSSVSAIEEKYKMILNGKDKQIKEFMQKHDQEKNRSSDAKELHQLQNEEVVKMKTMLIHAQTEMSRKTAELIEKTKKIEHLDKEYSEQRLELSEMDERLENLSRDRTRFEMKEKQLSMQVAALEKEKSALKSQLSDLIAELTQKSSMFESLQLAAERSNEEVSSLRQTYNLYKAKMSSEVDEKDTTIINLKERVGDLEQRIKDTKLSENDQVRAIEKERVLLEKRLKDTREELVELKSQSNDKISTMGSLVASLDEKLKEKVIALESLQKDHVAQQQHYEKQISKLNQHISQAEEVSRSLQLDSNHVENLQKKIKELDQKCSILKTEKMELEILADKTSFLEAQNKLLDTRFKETVERLEHDRSLLEEKVKELQSESRKSTYRSEHTNRRRMEQLETKIEEQNRIIAQYREEFQDIKDEKDILSTDLTIKETECQEVAACLEEAMTNTNDLKKEISILQESLQEKEELISCIKENESSTEQPSIDSLTKNETSVFQELLNTREQDLMDRDEEIEELQKVIQSRDEELAEMSKQLSQFKENNRGLNGRRLKSSNEKELQNTINKLTNRVQELENLQNNHEDCELAIDNRTLQAELEESKQKIRQLQQNLNDLKKQYQKQLKGEQESVNKEYHKQGENKQLKTPENIEDKEFLDVNFKYLKHVILKYMCSTNEQSRQLVSVIGHLLQFTPREGAIVMDCFDWKLPLEKKR